LIIILTSFATVTYVINKSNQAMLNISGSPTACTDACLTSGVSECSGTQAYQTCGNYDEDDCLEWGETINCPVDYECDGGVCVLSGVCADECTPDGTLQCSGTQAYQTCGNYDEDDCLEWGEAIACTEGFECISNECQPAVLGRSCPFFAMSLNIPYLQGLSGEGPVIEQLYKEALVDLFTWSMPAGTAKWPFIHPEQDVYNPLGVQFVLDWLNNNGMSYNIFHNVVVPKIPEIPEWYWNLPTQSDRLLALEDHVQTVMAFFGDQIPIYNVINHIYNNNFKNTPDNYLLTGQDRLTVATNILTWAREANPNVELIVNEGGDIDVAGVIIYEENRLNYIQFLTDLINNGAPLDGIGLMGHFGRDVGQGASKLPADILRVALDDYSELGLPIYITEFDLSPAFLMDIDPSFNPDDPFEEYGSWWEYQSVAYQEAMDIFQEYPLVKMVHFWTLYDGLAWMPGSGLFDEVMDPKPVHTTLENFLREAKNRECLAD